MQHLIQAWWSKLWMATKSKCQNPRTTPSGRKVTQEREEENKMLLILATTFYLQCPSAAHTLLSQQNRLCLCLYLLWTEMLLNVIWENADVFFLIPPGVKYINVFNFDFYFFPYALCIIHYALWFVHHALCITHYEYTCCITHYLTLCSVL